MKIDRILIVLGVVLLTIAIALVGKSWFATLLDTVPTEAEVTEPIAMIIAGVIALVSLIAACYLALEEWKEAKNRRVEANKEGRF